jgi:hypothetical protein
LREQRSRAAASFGVCKSVIAVAQAPESGSSAMAIKLMLTMPCLEIELIVGGCTPANHNDSVITVDFNSLY